MIEQIGGGGGAKQICEIYREIFINGINLWNWPPILMWSARRMRTLPLSPDPGSAPGRRVVVDVWGQLNAIGG
jgi:hypothetical protein